MLTPRALSGAFLREERAGVNPRSLLAECDECPKREGTPQTKTLINTFMNRRGAR